MSMLIAGARDAELSVRVCPGREQVMSVIDEDVYSSTVPRIIPPNAVSKRKLPDLEQLCAVPVVRRSERSICCEEQRSPLPVESLWSCCGRSSRHARPSSEHHEHGPGGVALAAVGGRRCGEDSRSHTRRQEEEEVQGCDSVVPARRDGHVQAHAGERRARGDGPTDARAGAELGCR